jgi:ABC-2 type transport system ATP-binding protein
MLSQPAIQIQDLRKNFGGLTAVDGVSFEVAPGEIFSLLGPNGAGKTTLISMLSGLLRPDGGEASLLGHSLRSDGQAARAALGVVPQDIALYLDLSARENLTFWGRMYGLGGGALKKRVDEVLDLIGLADRQNERVGKYSGGMKRRVNIGVALLHRPRVIIMDEPTVGIDPQSRRAILDSVSALKDQGMTVLYTTHYMEEAQELSDHIAIMDHGKLIACGSYAELVRIVGECQRIRLSANAAPAGVIAAWQAAPGVQQVTVAGKDTGGVTQDDTPGDREITLLVDDANRVLPRLFEAAEVGLRITSVEVQTPGLEAVFLHLTGRVLRD